MGWEVAENDGRFTFFCNTADIAFGPVMYLYTSCITIGMFYDTWNSLRLPDPRTMDDEECSDAVRKMREYLEEEE